MTSIRDADYREIPEELQREIFSWLPGKSLARFNCVCKLWDNSFSANAFLLRRSHSPDHPDKFYLCSSYLIESSFDPTASAATTTTSAAATTTTTTNNGGDVSGSDGEDDDEGYDYDFDYHYGYPYNEYSDDDNDNDNDNDISTRIAKGVRIPLTTLPPAFVSSGKVSVSNFCDGLVCLYIGKNYLPNLSILLYSVSINNFLVLPGKRDKVSSFASGYVYVGRLLLCCLGFDPILKKFTVFRIVSGDNCSNEYEILTIGSKSWKGIDDDRLPGSIRQGLPHEGSFCLNGVVYWVNECDGGHNYDHGPIRIVIGSLDLASEEFRAFEVGKIMGSPYSFEHQYYLTALRGCATLFCRERGHGDQILQWTLSNHPNGVWTRRMDTSHIPRSIWTRDYQYVGGRIMVKRLRSNSSRFSCYDVETGDHWVIKIEDENETDQVLQICNDMEIYVTSSS